MWLVNCDGALLSLFFVAPSILDCEFLSNVGFVICSTFNSFSDLGESLSLMMSEKRGAFKLDKTHLEEAYQSAWNSIKVMH